MFEFLVGPARFLYYDRRGPVYFVGWFCFVFRLSSLVFARSRFLFGAVVLILFAIMFSFCVVLRCHVNYLCDFVSFFAWSCVVAPWSRSVFGWPCLVSAWSCFFFFRRGRVYFLREFACLNEVGVLQLVLYHGFKTKMAVEGNLRKFISFKKKGPETTSRNCLRFKIQFFKNENKASYPVCFLKQFFRRSKAVYFISRVRFFFAFETILLYFTWFFFF